MNHYVKLPREVMDSASFDVFRSQLAAFLEDALAKTKLLGSIQG